MRKKLAVLGIAFVMLFTFAAAGCGGDPNRGRIRGLDGGEFVAHHDRGVQVFQWGEHFVDYRSYVTKVISNRSELVEWLYVTTLEWIEWAKRQDWVNPELAGFNPYNDEILAAYCDYFFESNQLVFINFMGGILDYNVERITYQDDVLKIEFIAIWRGRGGLIHPGIWRTAIIEITRICSNLSIQFFDRVHRRIRLFY